jgi:hypothetical protein
MAGFNLNNFRSDISKNGVLQTNKFIVAFNSPRCMQNSYFGTNQGTNDVLTTERLMQVRAESVKVPGVALLQSDINRYGVGPSQKMPFNARFTENSITFISDRNSQIYMYFYTWMNKIFDFSGSAYESNVGASYATEYKDNYVTDLHVYVYDNAGNQVNDIVMYRAFPESINDINLSWSDNSNLMKITVSISYRDWAMVGVSSAMNSQIQATPTNPFTTFAGNPSGAQATLTSDTTKEILNSQEAMQGTGPLAVGSPFG